MSYRRPYCIALAICLPGLALSACKDPAPSKPRATQTAQLTMRTRPFVGTTAPLQACADGLTVPTVYVIRIGRGGTLDIHNPGRDVKTNKVTGGDEDPGKGTDDQGPSDAVTRFDVDLGNQIHGKKTGVMIKIKILDDDIEFADRRGAPGVNSVLAFAGDNGYSSSVLCGVESVQSDNHQDDGDGKSHLSLKFYAQNTAKGMGVARFNVNLLVWDRKKNQYVLPVILDPEIKNEG